MDINYLIEQYKNSLNDLERKALIIAEKNLRSSFCIEKSIGFLEFLKSQNQWWLWPSYINKNNDNIPNIVPIICFFVNFSPKKK